MYLYIFLISESFKKCPLRATNPISWYAFPNLFTKSCFKDKSSEIKSLKLTDGIFGII